METDVLVGFLIGVGVGAAAALVLAPESGEQVRERIKTKADEGTEYLKQRGSELRTSTGDMIDAGKKVIGRAKENINEAVEASKQSYEDTVNS